MKFNKRLFKVVTIVISTLLLVLVVSRMHLSDKVNLATGETVKGKIVEIDDQVVVVRESGGALRRIASAEIGKDVKGKPDIERGLGVVLERAGDIKGLKWVILALMLFAVPPVVGALRWRALMRMQGIELGVGKCESLTFIGYLFNYITPGLTGGDVVKAYYVSRETHRKTAAVLSVFTDRVIGLIALTILGLAVVLTKVGDPEFGNVLLPIEIFTLMGVFAGLVMLSRRLRRHMPQTLVGVAAVGGGAVEAGRVMMLGFAAVRTEVSIFAGVIAVCAAVVLSPARKWLRWEALKNRLKGYSFVREADASFSVYRKHRWGLAAVFGVSVAIHVVNVIGVYSCGRALGVERGLMTYMVLVPVIIMISSIPITVAGLGVQETMFPFFFGLRSVDVGANEAAMLAFMFRLGSSFIWVAPGYVMLLFWRGRTTVGAVAEEAMKSENETLPAQ